MRTGQKIVRLSCGVFSRVRKHFIGELTQRENCKDFQRSSPFSFLMVVFFVFEEENQKWPGKDYLHGTPRIRSGQEIFIEENCNTKHRRGFCEDRHRRQHFVTNTHLVLSHFQTFSLSFADFPISVVGSKKTDRQPQIIFRTRSRMNQGRV